MRRLYTLLVLLFAPLALALLLWRGRREHAHRGRLAERFGRGASLPRDAIWVHAASVGEVQAAAPLVRALQRRHPELAIVVTTMTSTGSTRARAQLGDGVEVRYLPLDLPWTMRRFLTCSRAVAVVIVETELWPTLLGVCAERHVPVILASARVSERSARRYRWLGAALAAPLARVRIGAQSEADAQRFLALGATPALTQVLGNLKFDLQLPAEIVAQGTALREQLGSGPVWVAGSTHEGEETAALEVHRRLLARWPQALLLLAPRHPQRFAAVTALVRETGLSFVARSSGQSVTTNTRVLLVDTLGELLQCYAAADVAFVGGSLVPIGGHNLLEPAALGRAVITGPHTQNAPEVATLLREAQALVHVEDVEGLHEALAALLADTTRREQLGAAGRDVVARNRGALARLLELIDAAISPAHRR